MIKFKRGKFKTIETTIADQTIVIGPDTGTVGNKVYYYVEVDGKVVMHGFDRQKDAKQFVLELFSGVSSLKRGQYAE